MRTLVRTGCFLVAALLVVAAPARADESGPGRLDVDPDGRLVVAVDSDHDGATDVAYVADPGDRAPVPGGFVPWTAPIHVSLDGPCLTVRDLEGGRLVVASTGDPEACPLRTDVDEHVVLRLRAAGIVHSSDPVWGAAPDRFDAGSIRVLGPVAGPESITCSLERCKVTADTDCQVGGPGAIGATVDCGAGGFLGGSLNGQKHSVTCGPDSYACGRCDGPVGYAQCQPYNCFERLGGIYDTCDPDRPRKPKPTDPE